MKLSECHERYIYALSEIGSIGPSIEKPLCLVKDKSYFLRNFAHPYKRMLVRK